MLRNLFEGGAPIAAQSSAAMAHMKSPLPVRQGFMTVNANLAERFLNEATFDGQRSTDPIYVARHLENLKRGMWLAGSQIAFARLGDNFYLINGKHRMTAIVAYGKEAEVSVVVYDCDTMDDVRSLYARFDNVQRARSVPQILAASDLAGQLGVGTAIATATYQAVPLLLNGLKQVFNNDSSTSRLRVDLGLVDYRISAALMWRDQARIYERCLAPAEGKLRRKLLTANIVAVAFYTLKHARPQAEEFWSGVALDDGLRRGDPRHTFKNFVMSSDLKKSDTTRGVTAVTSLAWNAWYEDRKLSSIRTGSLTNITFSGTPLGRRR